MSHDHSYENIDVYYDGVNLPFDDESFDCIFSSEVFEHVLLLDEVLSEMNGVLKRRIYFSYSAICLERT